LRLRGITAINDFNHNKINTLRTAIFTPTNSTVILDIPKKYVGKKVAITYFLTSDIVEQQAELPQELKSE
jgi:hypothetical protein